MPTKRTPLRRAMQQQITSGAIEAFKRMEELRTQCTCPPVDWEGEYWKHEMCAACEEWFDNHSVLHRELGCKLWEWPAISHPDDCNPYPAGCAAAKRWDAERAAHPERIELYHELVEAAENE